MLPKVWPSTLKDRVFNHVPYSQNLCFVYNILKQALNSGMDGINLMFIGARQDMAIIPTTGWTKKLRVECRFSQLTNDCAQLVWCSSSARQFWISCLFPTSPENNLTCVHHNLDVSSAVWTPSGKIKMATSSIRWSILEGRIAHNPLAIRSGLEVGKKGRTFQTIELLVSIILWECNATLLQ